MKTRTLLALVFALIVVGVSARSLWGFSNFSRLLSDYGRIVQRDDLGEAVINDVAQIAVDLETGVRGWLVSEDPRYREPYERQVRRMAPALDRLVAFEREHADTLSRAESVRARLNEWDRLVAAPLLTPDARRRADFAALNLDGKRRMDAVRDDLAVLRERLAARRQAHIARVEAFRDRFRDEALLTSTIVVVFLIAMGLLLSRWIEGPLAQLAVYAEQTGEGHVGRVEVKGVREVERLAEALTAMSSRLAAKRAQEQRRTALLATLSAGGSVEALADAALRAVARDHHAVGAALWVTREEGGALEVAATVALDREALGAAPSALVREVASTGRAVRVDDLEASAGRVVKAGLVHVVPRALLVAPLHAGAALVGVVELAGPLRDASAELDQALVSVGLALRNAVTGDKAVRLQTRVAAANEELQAQNEEMRAQEEELRSQSEELIARQTELAQRNQELDRASRLKSEFLSNMSHELRTPLNAVIGFAEILLNGTYGGLADEQSSAVHDIAAAGRQLLALVNDILDLSRIEAGHLDLQVAELDVAPIVHEALSLVAPTVDRKRLTVSAPPRDAPHRAVGDHGRVRQVIANLLSNAVKFTPAGGAITVTVTDEAAGVRVAVRDTGPGIRADDQARLFQPFTQVGGHQKPGTGLGLSISRRLVDLMGGALGLTSEPGHGATFFFTLPAAGAAGYEPFAAGDIEAPPASSAASARGQLVVIVEDSPGEARVTESLLVREGYTVRVATSAEAALTLIAREVPALLIVDLGLPGMSGFALIERVRASSRTRAVPIMVLTARDLSDDERCDLRERVQFIATKGVMTGGGFHDAVAALCDASARRQRVLVIDDSEMNRRVASAMLAPAGYLVREAADAEAGLRMARDSVPDAILMDVRMPGMSGLEATAALRADPRTRAVPIVAVSAHAMPGDGERCLAAGCDAYITKPVARHELLRALAECIARAAAQRADES